jgi:hypothetical protein
MINPFDRQNFIWALDVVLAVGETVVASAVALPDGEGTVVVETFDVVALLAVPAISVPLAATVAVPFEANVTLLVSFPDVCAPVNVALLFCSWPTVVPFSGNICPVEVRFVAKVLFSTVNVTFSTIADVTF